MCWCAAAAVMCPFRPRGRARPSTHATHGRPPPMRLSPSERRVALSFNGMRAAASRRRRRDNFARVQASAANGAGAAARRRAMVRRNSSRRVETLRLKMPRGYWTSRSAPAATTPPPEDGCAALRSIVAESTISTIRFGKTFPLGPSGPTQRRLS